MMQAMFAGIAAGLTVICVIVAVAIGLAGIAYVVGAVIANFLF